ncbi:hypothetical protein GGS23DRAFT_66333 [Durotheca rogersii]|uniref:uncharacterized protein n=1 Tax=Durotheca rogersii TaxID=419775 RepID=UPI00222047A2|nr:uncharacterized protein GGS23DRAFT_66333 [Durotheca rogersii]KAI5862778.1 hypothetical protein GGS23DRAFT_66333 [Durotheca rogersii]
MGIQGRPEPHRPPVFPNTPPGLVSPTSSAHTPRISEEPTWAATTTVPISPPMSSYDPSTRSDMSTKEPEEGQVRRESVQSAPRQQLPSLSSLFGPAHHVRPAPSPRLDRPSLLHSSHPPLDRPQSRSSSYFPNVSPPLSQPRSVYEPRLEPERPTLPSVASQFPGPLKSPTRDFDHPNHAPRGEPSPRRWPSMSHLDSRRGEYVFESPSAAPPFRSERMPLPPLGQRLGFETSPVFKRENAMHLEPSGRSPTLVGALMPEGAPVKDGLGPKIWTGTHFLPRFVKQAEVPGEGMCYFYDDGTHCKTVIDGEPVNAHWGVTKAGKPRKRLAIACLTCREKKIKCDPDYPRCVQCEKFGRVCKFKNAPRGGHNTSPVASPAEHDLSNVRQFGAQPSVTDFGRPRSTSSTPVSPRTNKMGRHSPELLPGLPPKRVRYSYDEYPRHPPLPPSRSSPMMPIPDMKKAANGAIPAWQHHDFGRDILSRPWQTDPRPHTRV